MFSKLIFKFTFVRVLTQWLSHLEDRIKNPPMNQHHHEHTWDGYGGGPNTNGHSNNGE
jgi:hypothetical protein